MNIKKMRCYLGLLAVCIGFGVQADIPLSFSEPGKLDQIQDHVMPALDNAQLRQRDVRAGALSSETPVLRYAEPIQVSIKPKMWQQIRLTQNGTTSEMSVWRTRINSRGALSLNFGFTEYFMPEGGSLHIYTPDHSQRIRPFTAADNEVHGQLWTPMIKGDTIIIEVNVPTNTRNQLKLNLTSVNHGYLGASVNEVFQILSGSCNVDVVCSEGDGWRDQIRSAAAISTGGSGFCSGGALNNTANDGRGFFLTAAHCGINSGNAPSLVTYWNFENSYCRVPGSSDSGGQGDGTLNQFNTGAIFRASYTPSDMTLVELDDPFDPAHNVYLAGWNAGDTASSSAVAIHHPSVDEKRISFENDPTAITSYSGTSSPGDGTHIRVVDWDLGTTEPGSSGSHLFDQNKRVIGQLHGGGAACGNNQSDWYGWLHASWTGGGTNSSRLSNWLDPTNSGQTAIDGMNANGGGGGNLSPSANANGPYSGFVNDTINFSSAGSNDPDGSIVSYLWDFGDGSATSNAANPSHNYSAAGSYNVSLTVTDNEGATGVANTTATITLEGDGELTPGVPQTGLSGDQGTELRYYMDVPENAVNLTFDTSGGSGDADLYVKFGSEPTTSDWDCRPYSASGTENCTFSSPQVGRYHVMVRAYGNISNYDLVGNYTVGGGGSDSFEDSNLSASRGQWKYYTLEVTAGMTSLTANMSGGTGDADLYVRFGAQPTTSNWECRPYTSGNNEDCVINNPQVGTWHVGIRAYRSYSGVDISGLAQ